jgi:molecular chaperone GrpE
MNPKDQIPKPDDVLTELDFDGSGSVDDFIKELEAKEKDLHITSDMSIEVAEDFGAPEEPDFVQQDLNPTEPARNGSNPPGLKTRVYELENEVISLKDKIREIRSERNDIQEKSDRRLKDFENYKYRMDRERRGAFIDQISNLASQMLPVLDNLERALTSATMLAVEKSPEFQQFYDGIVLVNQQVSEVFASMGVQPIISIGETFDPNFHEAVAAEDRDDLPPNTISDEMLRGYKIGNRVIRHSMVRVTTSSAVRKPVPPSHDELPDLDPEDGTNV